MFSTFLQMIEEKNVIFIGRQLMIKEIKIYMIFQEILVLVLQEFRK